MQKITGELKNTPLDVQSLQVQGSVSSQLNKEETLSAENKVLTVINPEGVQSQHTGRPIKPFMYAFYRKKAIRKRI